MAAHRNDACTCKPCLYSDSELRSRTCSGRTEVSFLRQPVPKMVPESLEAAVSRKFGLVCQRPPSQSRSKLARVARSWRCLRMPIDLVDGDYRLHVLAYESAFREYVNGHKDLKGNMSNMLELLGVFSGKRESKVTYKYKHMLLHDVIWLTFGDGSTIVPLVGSPMQICSPRADGSPRMFPYQPRCFSTPPTCGALRSAV